MMLSEVDSREDDKKEHYSSHITVYTAIYEVIMYNMSGARIAQLGFACRTGSNPASDAIKISISDGLGSVVQSIVSLTPSLRRQLVKHMPTKLSNTLLFFVGKM